MNDVCLVGIENYVLGSSFSQSTLQKGGVCIYICNDICFHHLYFSNYCKEEILAICAVQIETTDKRTIVICMHRSPSDDFNHFLRLLDMALVSEQAIHGDTHLWRL